MAQAASAEVRLVIREDAALRLRREKELADEALRGNWCVIRLLRIAKAPRALEAVEAGLAAGNLTTSRKPLSGSLRRALTCRQAAKARAAVPAVQRDGRPHSDSSSLLHRAPGA